MDVVFYEKLISYQTNFYKFSFNYLKNKGEIIHYNYKDQAIEKRQLINKCLKILH
ncbi:hypothetical protein GA0061080_100840 [Gilliamella intestini]|uniref:Uncharacterized protein n=1 Tax=Gilliamella intestini TaxID=1798183 RepID=A0A1C4A3Y5_9GAMM|nr:hypothetical protein GA0061080_100840 [Gilliamella intestini]